MQPSDSAGGRGSRPAGSRPQPSRPPAPVPAGPGTGLRGEVEKFDRLAARWWDPRGPMAPLHAMNPARMGWIVSRIARRHGRDPASPGALAGLRILDVGCGAGLASEALARAGAAVTGLDAAGRALAVARAHAAGAGLSIAYRDGTPEALLAAGERGAFDAVLALEVVEHVADRDAFCRHLAVLARPRGGLVFLSTLNRTARSFLFAKLGAEYVLRLLPAGTHDWRMFVRPSELGTSLRLAGLRVADLAGLTMDPLTGRWRTSRDVGVNYIVMAEA
jgi:2-polyprenyl-6-hydroxyphenyl methylase / 3-demethylubiquinone-9 3-methyltransferase